MTDLLSLIWKDCPECEGSHETLIDKFCTLECPGGPCEDCEATPDKCRTCGDEGRIPRYFTHSEWEKETGIKCGPDTPVWYQWDGPDGRWHVDRRLSWFEEQLEEGCVTILVDLSALGQPRPTDDYRHEVTG